jgi:hypothetical protein
MEKGKILVSSPYDMELEKFNASQLKVRLSEKFRIKPYYEQNRNKRYLALFSSYLFNLLSIATAYYFLFKLLDPLVGLYFSSFLSVLLLMIAELSKRFLIAPILQRYYQFRRISILLILSTLLLICFSALLSYKGANLAFKELKPNLALIDTDSIQNAYRSQIKPLEAKQKELLSIKYKGVTTRTAQKAALEAEKQLSAIRKDLSIELATAKNKNESISIENKQIKANEGFYFSLLALLFDSLLILCLVYIEYYDFRSIAEFSEATIGAMPLKNEQTEHLKKGACLNCSKSFIKSVPNKKYCSDECRISAYEKRSGKELKYKPK